MTARIPPWLVRYQRHHRLTVRSCERLAELELELRDTGHAVSQEEIIDAAIRRVDVQDVIDELKTDLYEAERWREST